MAKIVRYNGNLVPFASASLGTERTIFGEVTQADDITSQYTADFLRGWGIVGPSDQPTLQDFNAVSYTHGQILSYLHQMGVAEYNATQEYHLGSITTEAGVPYVSLVNTNVGNTPASSPLQWYEILSSGRVVVSSAGVTAWAVPIAMQLGIIKPRVSLTGGGGGGGGATSATGAAGGGGGGAPTAFKLIDLTGVSSVNITIGTGGAGGVGNNTGATGGASSFGAFISASGGSGGVQSTGGSTISGAGGSSTSGADFSILGGAGKFSLVVNGVFSAAGPGGDSFYGKGVGAPNLSGTATAQLTGTAGVLGAGGSGGTAYNATATGGAGGNGHCVIEW